MTTATKTKQMKQTKLPRFQGKPLIEIPKTIPQANFLEGEFGKAVLEEYKGRAKADCNNASALNILKYKDNVVKGSNPFAVVLINQIVKPERLRTATQADLEKILKTKALDLEGFYEDSALVLRSKDEPNSYLTQDLIKQLKARNPKLKLPVMMPLTELEIVADNNSDYGLAFKLKDNAEIIYAPILNKDDGNFSSEDTDEKTGLPKKLGKGNRVLYTRSSGLSGLCLGRDLFLYSWSGDLADSDEDGRVVVVSAEGALQKINRYVSKLQKDKKRKDIELEAFFQEAREELDGGYQRAIDKLRGKQ